LLRDKLVRKGDPRLQKPDIFKQPKKIKSFLVISQMTINNQHRVEQQTF